MGQRALAQMASPPLVRARWKVMSWVQDLLGACVTYKLFIKIIIKKKGKKKKKAYDWVQQFNSQEQDNQKNLKRKMEDVWD